MSKPTTKLIIPLGIILIVAVIFVLTKKTGLIANLRKNTSPTIQNLIPETKKEMTILTVQSGEATIQTGVENKKIAQNKSADLTNGDIITTNKEGIAVIKYPNGTVIRIAPDSSLTITIDIESVAANLSQTTGTIFVRFKKVLGVQEEMNVETPTAVATVRGTKLISRIDRVLGSKFIVTEHEIEIFKKDEKTRKKIENTKQIIREGFQGTVDRKALVKVAKQVLTEEEKRWIQYNIDSDNLDNETKLEIFKEIVSRYLSSPSPSPKASFSPLPSGVSPTPKPAIYIQNMFGTGYNTGRVKTESGEFPISCYGEAQSSVKVITDSANESDCKTDCPVLPLHEYAVRNNGIAAINGMYFCPADYPSCSEKKNSFDTLFFNSRVKRYINSDNNVYSSIPFLVINLDASARFVGRSMDWGRDTGIMAGTAGNPILIQGGNISAVEANLDEKQRLVKANRGAFVQKAPNLYLCIVGSATVMDTANVYKTLGVDNAINIDGGGSSALWVSGSYKYGPGRNIPTAIIFARR